MPGSSSRMPYAPQGVKGFDYDWQPGTICAILIQTIRPYQNGRQIGYTFCIVKRTLGNQRKGSLGDL